MYFNKKDKNIGWLNILSVCILICLAIASGILVFLSQLKNVSINYNGRVIVAKTMSKTVEDVLKEQKITYNNSNVYPKLNQKLSSQNNIINVTKNLQIKTIAQVTLPKEQPIVAANDNTNSSNQDKLSLESRERVVAKQEAKLVITPKPVERKLVAKATKRKVYETKVTNSRGTVTTSRGDVVRFKKVLDMQATAYCSCYACCGKHPGDRYYGITATGAKARPGIIAVDPKVIPLGSRVYVESADGSKNYGYALAADTGGAIKGGIIDLYYESHKEVDNWGRRYVKVYVLE